MSCVRFMWQSEQIFDWSQMEARTQAIANSPLPTCDLSIEPVEALASELPAFVHGPTLNTAARFCRSATAAPRRPQTEMMSVPCATSSKQD